MKSIATSLRARRIKLLATTLLVSLSIVELGYRIVDPFPFIDPDGVNRTEHGNLTEYDKLLGWRGVANGSSICVTQNSRTRLRHNRHGFRDVPVEKRDVRKPAIAFCGDSFTWGYEVEFDQMFVNRLQHMLPHYEIYNLSHRGYGTDQQLLTFNRWDAKQQIELVIVMFSENDVADNNGQVRYSKPKPTYRLMDDQLFLTGIPVPKVDA